MSTGCCELLDLPDRFRSTVPAAASSRDRRRRPPSAPSWRRASGSPRARSTAPGPPAGSSPTPPPRPTRRSRRGCASPASAATTSASSPSTTRSPCAPTRSPPPSPPTAPPGWCRSSCAPRRARPRRLAFDPVPAIADVCRREGLWLHVDAAMAGIAALCPELPLGQRRRRAGRLVLHQPAQVDGHQLRLRPVLRGRPRGAARRAVDPARVPAHRGGRRRRRRRLPRLADPARPPVPRPKVWFTLRADGPEPAGR